MNHALGGEQAIDHFHLSLHLAAVLERLPIAIGLVATSGRYVGKAGACADLIGTTVPSRSAREAGRWAFTDARGGAIPPADWPSGRALRGERDYTGMVGIFRDGGDRPIKVISVPTLDRTGSVAAVTFLQMLDARGRSIDGSHLDLQQRLIEELARAVSTGWDRFDPLIDRLAS